jgi:hypothetical protein
MAQRQVKLALMTTLNAALTMCTWVHEWRIRE